MLNVLFRVPILLKLLQQLRAAFLQERPAEALAERPHYAIHALLLGLPCMRYLESQSCANLRPRTRWSSAY